MTKNFFHVFIYSMKINSVTFGANPLNTVKIKKFDKKAKDFVDFPATFIKLEPYNEFDLMAVDEAAQKWKDAKFIRKIATASHWMKEAPIDIYAITAQKKKFDKLNPDEILGFAEMRNDNSFPGFKWLYYLQVKPDAININNTGKKIYKHVGTSIIKSLKKVYKNISLYSENSPNIMKFYKKNGFIEDSAAERHYLWSSNIFKRLKIHYNKKINQWGI